jgi:hypothetical protein
MILKQLRKWKLLVIFLARMIESSRIRRGEHETQIGEMRNECKILGGKTEGKNDLG